MRILQAQKGFFIIEAMISLSLLTVGFLGLLTLLASSLGLNRVVTDTYIANYLAIEGVEIIKNVIDANVAHGQNFNKNCIWSTGFNAEKTYEIDAQIPSVTPSDSGCPGEVLVGDIMIGAGRPLKFDVSSGEYEYDTGTNSVFRRRVTVSPVNDNELRVNSVVAWTTRGGGNFTVNVEDHLYNWSRP
ncbi:MAG: hypothetical protein NUV53_01070 [Patescibacteria group bacterium]|nr:hypothetical protein [Patescibacteria group bacterium]